MGLIEGATDLDSFGVLALELEARQSDPLDHRLINQTALYTPCLRSALKFG